jgi:hypothetical protein
LHAPERADGAGVVERAVQGAVRRQGGLDQAADVDLRRDIRGHERGGAAARDDLADNLGTPVGVAA